MGGGSYITVSGSGGGGGSGSGGPNNTTSLQDITNNLTTPCFSSVFNSLNTGGLKNEITNIFRNTFNVTDLINYTVQEAATLSDNTICAQTRPQINKTSTTPTVTFYNITTTLNDSKLKTASKEYIAETMFHEILHGYLEVNTNLKTEMEQHCEMIESYVYCEITALQELFPNLSTHDATCLILGGFSQIQEYDQTTLNTLLSNYGLTLNDVVNTNNSYESGSKGTHC